MSLSAAPEPTLSLPDFIDSLAREAKRVSAEHDIPIEGAVELVKTGVQFLIAAGSAPLLDEDIPLLDPVEPTPLHSVN